MSGKANTMQDRFEKGLATIRNALDAAIHDRGVEGSRVDCSIDASGAQSARFSITADGKTEVQNFSREEIEDSGDAIDAPVSLKVRMLVSHFVR